MKLNPTAHKQRARSCTSYSTFRIQNSALPDLRHSAFRNPNSESLPSHTPHSAFRSPNSAFLSAFTLLELLVVIGIISLLLVAVIPAVNSLSKSSGRKGAISNVMNALEQARSLALTSGSPTYVVFADQTTPENYRCKAYIIFQEKNFVPTAVTKWNFLPTGIAFQPGTGTLTAQVGTPLRFLCPGTIGITPVALPYIKFDSSGMVAYPANAANMFANIFSGFVDASGTMTYTDKNQQTTQNFDKIVISHFTGRTRYVDPYG